MIRIVPLLCLLSACAAPTTYRQAAMPLPMPEPMAEPLPPSMRQGPHVGPAFGGAEQVGERRELPPTRKGTAYPAEAQPVIRAADEFRKSTTPYAVSAILGPVPGLPRDVPDECAQKMTTALLGVFPTLLSRDISTDDALCLDARLMDLCVSQWLGKRTDEVAAVIRLKMQQHVKSRCGRRYLDDPNEPVNLWFFPVRNALAKK